ncbi:MAG: cytidylyltransferase domain-containing protein [Promethearchaeota archaeon]
MRKILIICQARYGSTRLPGKVLMKIQNKPLLWYVIKRLELIRIPCKIIIAIADSDENIPIIKLAKNLKIDYFVGDELDVLDRYYQAAKYFSGDIIIRITSDCPLIDPDIIENAINIYLNGNYDYVSNVHPPTYPDGFDVEIFSFSALEHAWRESILPSEREHVTPYIWKNPDKFKLKNFENIEDLSKIRLTVDTIEDFKLISNIIERFYYKWESFRMRDVIDYLKINPKLLKMNAQYKRNEGYFKSLIEDKYFIKKKIKK